LVKTIRARLKLVSIIRNHHCSSGPGPLRVFFGSAQARPALCFALPLPLSAGSHVSALPLCCLTRSHPVATHRAPRSPGPTRQPFASAPLTSRHPPLSHDNADTRARRPGADAGRSSHSLPRPGPLSPTRSALHVSLDSPDPLRCVPPVPL
jgi:hypothetical protein